MVGITDKKTSINAAAIALAFAMPLGSTPMYMGWDLGYEPSRALIRRERKPKGKDRSKVKAQRKANHRRRK